MRPKCSVLTSWCYGVISVEHKIIPVAASSDRLAGRKAWRDQVTDHSAIISGNRSDQAVPVAGIFDGSADLGKPDPARRPRQLGTSYPSDRDNEGTVHGNREA